MQPFASAPRTGLPPVLARPGSEPRDDAPPRLSVVLPAFDEAHRIRGTVADLASALSATLGDRYELLIIDDGSRDETLEAAMDAADAFPRCRVVSYAHNAGKGWALRRGLASARGAWVAFFDADGDIESEALQKLLATMDASRGVSAVVGRRRWARPRPLHRRVASGVLSRFARLALDVPLPETQAGVKLFVRGDVLRVLPECRERGYLFDLELLARMRRERLRMVSVDLRPLQTRRSRIGIRDCVREILPALRIWAAMISRQSTVRTETSALRAPVPLATVRDELIR